MKNISVFISIPVIIVSLLILINSNFQGSEWCTKNLKLFGTTVTIQLNHKNRSIRDSAIQKIIDEFKRIEAKFSPYISTSELSIINKTAYGNIFKVSDETAELIRFSLKISRLSEGAFDITYASVGNLYDFRKKTKPNQDQLDKGFSGIGYTNLKLDQNNNLTFKNQNTKISFGGFAKGYAVKKAIDIIKGYGIRNALVTAGGDSMVIGLKDNNPWRTGIKAPRGPVRAVYTFNLTDKAISTSGDYERFFVSNDGDRIHHIVNPSTGKSASDVQSVTVIGNNPTFTDALSTSMFVMGARRSIVLAENLKNIEVLVIDKSGSIHKSSGFPKHQNFSDK